MIGLGKALRKQTPIQVVFPVQQFQPTPYFQKMNTLRSKQQLAAFLDLLAYGTASCAHLGPRSSEYVLCNGIVARSSSLR